MKQHKLKLFTYLACSVFISVVLLSNIGTVQASRNTEIVSQANLQLDARALAKKLYDEGLKLYKLSTAESLQQAIGKWKEALKLYQKIGDKKSQATTVYSIGNAYDSLGDKQQALKFYNQSLPLMIELGDSSGQALTLNNIGYIYSSLGDKQQALKLYNQSLPLMIEVGDSSGQAMTLNNIGNVYESLGDKQQALKFYNQSLALRIEIGDKAGQAITLNNIGHIYSSLGDNQQALKFYNQSLPLRIEVGDKGGQAITLNNIGGVYESLGDKQQALKFYNQSLPLTIEVGDKVQQATTFNNIGRVYDSLGDKQQALKFYNQSLPLVIEVGNKAVQAGILNNIGSVYDSLGNKQQALKSYNQSLSLMIEVGNPSGQAITLSNLAYLERSRGNLQESLKQIQAAIKIVENLRQKYTNKDLQTAYFASVQDYYQFYIDLLMELDKKYPSKGYDTSAFNASERSRARSLVELLAEANASIRSNVDLKLLAEEQLILSKIETIQSQMQEPSTDNTRLETLHLNNENLLKQYRELVDKIRTNSPQYASIQYPQPLELKQIQQQLDKDTLLLQYSLGANRSYLWAVTPNFFHTYELPKRSEIESSAEEFRSSITDLLSVSEPAKARKLNKLSQLIMAPVADKLAKKRLAIVADGVLQSIPFAALADPNVKAPSPYQPLIVNHEIVNLPSVTALATQRQRLSERSVAPKTLAVLADPVFEATDERLTNKPPVLAPELDLNRSSLQRALKNLNRNGLSRLKGTRKEAEAILKLVSPQESIHAYDFDANYNFIINPELKKYRFLLLATHGIVDTKNPELSGIVLSQVDKQGKPVEKGYLRLGDIFNLNLGAELVVLSACDTGLGKDVKGEGLIGLTRGLMYAGSKRALVSLWQIDDIGTSKLMPKFYEAVLKGKSSTTALREAQLKLWQGKDWQEPYYWAAFTLQGDWR